MRFDKLLAIFAAVFCVAACNGGDEPENPQSKPGFGGSINTKSFLSRFWQTRPTLRGGVVIEAADYEINCEDQGTPKAKSVLVGILLDEAHAVVGEHVLSSDLTDQSVAASVTVWADVGEVETAYLLTVGSVTIKEIGGGTTAVHVELIYNEDKSVVLSGNFDARECPRGEAF